MSTQDNWAPATIIRAVKKARQDIVDGVAEQHTALNQQFPPDLEALRTASRKVQDATTFLLAVVHVQQATTESGQ